MKMATNGDAAIAYSWKQINPAVVPAYPITPQTIIVERFSDYVHDGEVDTEYVTTESEHSAMTVAIAASAAGVRVATATASAGMALMWEMLGVCSGMRCPVVMAVANRTLSGPINIHCDHSDSMGARDTGWIQIYAENVQEAYDNSIIAFRIAEDMRVRLPIMSCLDGFILTHAYEDLEVLEDQQVKDFVGEHQQLNPLLDLSNPVTHGPLDLQDYFFEHKYQVIDAINGSLSVIKEVLDEFEALSGRKHFIAEPYMCDDADFVAIAIGSTAGTMKAVVDELRVDGKKVGLIKLKVFRPFPSQIIADMVKGKQGVAVLDRAISLGSTGPLFLEVNNALLSIEDSPSVCNYVYGIGGRDAPPSQLKQIYLDMMDGKSLPINYLGVRK